MQSKKSIIISESRITNIIERLEALEQEAHNLSTELHRLQLGSPRTDQLNPFSPSDDSSLDDNESDEGPRGYSSPANYRPGGIFYVPPRTSARINPTVPPRSTAVPPRPTVDPPRPIAVPPRSTVVPPKTVPKASKPTFQIGDRVSITNDYLNQYGTIGRITGLTAKRVTLRGERDGHSYSRSYANVRKL